MSRRRPGRRRVARIAAALVLVVVVVGVLVVNVWSPPADPVPQRVDAVVQLGGVTVNMYEDARELGRRGVTDQVVLSNVGRDHPDHEAQLCTPADRLTITCFDPEPADTRGEAREIGRLARERGWRSVYVLAADESHVTRARYIVSRCLPDDVDLDVGFHAVSRTPTQRVELWLYQYGGWAKALTEDGC